MTTLIELALASAGAASAVLAVAFALLALRAWRGMRPGTPAYDRAYLAHRMYRGR